MRYLIGYELRGEGRQDDHEVITHALLRMGAKRALTGLWILPHSPGLSAPTIFIAMRALIQEQDRTLVIATRAIPKAWYGVGLANPASLF